VKVSTFSPRILLLPSAVLLTSIQTWPSENCYTSPNPLYRECFRSDPQALWPFGEQKLNMQEYGPWTKAGNANLIVRAVAVSDSCCISFHFNASWPVLWFQESGTVPLTRLAYHFGTLVRAPDRICRGQYVWVLRFSLLYFHTILLTCCSREDEHAAYITRQHKLRDRMAWTIGISCHLTSRITRC
jgi:hypothetical protein